MRNYADQKVLTIIKKILNGEGDDKQLGSWLSNELKPFMPGISDLIFYSKEDLTPEEILKRVREIGKPICL